MTTPTPSVATRIAGVILCACFATHALADRGDTASPIAAAETASQAHNNAASLRPYAVAGEIIDEHGNPAPGVTVTVLTHGGEAVTDELGRYLIDTRIPLDAESISIVASLPDERTGQRITTHTASIEHDDPFLDAGVLSVRSVDECSPHWASDIFCGLGLSGTARASVVWDDGTGEALYVAGVFQTAGCEFVSNIARWDGAAWSALVGPNGVGTNGRVNALTVYDDGAGSGPVLFVGGEFNSAGGISAVGVAKWDGTEWTGVEDAIGNNLVIGQIHAFAIYDDGTGSAIFMGGRFNQVAGQTTNSIVKWDGTNWSPLTSALGTGVLSSTGVTAGGVKALHVHDDGTGNGSELYVGGDFEQAGGMTAYNIAKWNGTDWSTVAATSFFGVTQGEVRCLASYDDGSGTALYAGGTFSRADDLVARGIAKWDGTQWSVLAGPSGTGLSGSNRSAETLLVYDDGLGEKLYVGGSWLQAGGKPIRNLATWDGSDWFGLTTPTTTELDTGAPLTLSIFNDGAGPALFVAGGFIKAEDLNVNGIVKWDGSVWSNLVGPHPSTLTGNPLNMMAVNALTVYDDGSGPAIFVAGDFPLIDDMTANNIAKWNGQQWSALTGPSGTGVDGVAYALAVYNDGLGEALYVGGRFFTAGGISTSHIAKWDGSDWSGVGGGITDPNGNSSVRVLDVYDSGSGLELYVGGTFWQGGPSSYNNIARWNGTAWSTLSGASGSGVTNNIQSDPVVYSLAIHDDGDGPALYVGGKFQNAGGLLVNNIAKWNAASGWSALVDGSTIGIPNASDISAIQSYNDGSGPAMYAAGRFQAFNGVFVNNILKWNGSSWSVLSNASGVGVGRGVKALAVYDDGTGDGPALYVGGDFQFQGIDQVNFIAKWDGSDWASLNGPYGVGIDSFIAGVSTTAVNAFAVFDDGSGLGTALFMGGNFYSAGGIGSAYLAKWQGCPDITPAPCPGDINGDGIVDLNDFIILAGNFGSGPGATPQQGDLNNDGFVDLDDFIILAGNFGNDCN